MTMFLISFPSAALDPDVDLAAMSRDSHAVIEEAKAAGVYVFGGGLDESVAPALVAGDGTVTPGTHPGAAVPNRGYLVLDLPTREAANEWAAKVATACRCAQEVREFGYDPASAPSRADPERDAADVVVLAGMAVSDMERATRWYAALLGQGPDAEPMPGLADWRTPGGTIQVVRDPDRAGGSLLTLQVPDLHQFVADLATRGGPNLALDDTSSSNVLLTTTTDPDGNAITLVQVRDGVDL